MGLDCYFEKRVGAGQTAELPEFDRDLNICGGMFSGHGIDGSFRGKVYATLVQEICDISLYEVLTPEQVKDIAIGLQTFLEETDRQEFVYGYELTRPEIEDLQVMFEKFGELNYGLSAWY